MRITIVRHGETVENIKKIMQGHFEGTLSEKGIDQARRLGKRLESEDFDVVFCSDLLRTRQTCEEIMKDRSEPVIFTSQIRERDYGAYNGKPIEEFNSTARENNLDPMQFKPKGGENSSDLKKRARDFLRDLKEHEFDSVLIVGHGGTNTCMINELLPEKDRIDYETELGNTSITVFDLKNGKSELVSFNDTGHLN